MAETNGDEGMTAMGPLRAAGGKVLDVLVWPAGVAVRLMWGMLLSLPRRPPDLGRFTRSSGFGELHSAAVAWLDQNFERVGKAAPWLDRAGCQVIDWCRTSLGRPFGGPPSVRCTRRITAVYGLDGDLSGRLEELGAVLWGIGWGELSGDRTVPMQNIGRSEPPAWRFSWRPAGAFGLPAVLQTMPPFRAFPLYRWLDMGVGWVSKGRPAELVTTRAIVWPVSRGTATATYQPVEFNDMGIGELTRKALAGHAHALAIRIDVVYYFSPNVNVRGTRLRKKLLPVNARKNARRNMDNFKRPSGTA